jgi:hypothetical protein
VLVLIVVDRLELGMCSEESVDMADLAGFINIALRSRRRQFFVGLPNVDRNRN